MKTVQAKSWSEFKEAISAFRKEFAERSMASPKGPIELGKNTILFRGEAKTEWSLRTTLERKIDSQVSVGRYLFLAMSGLHEIESYSGHRWNLKSLAELQAELEREHFFRVHLPAYDYLIYLRQFGFPSPLLDWSESPYVAAFFAFESKEKGDESDCAVYCYVESKSGMKGASADQPFITLMGKYITTDKRHFSQRSWYTISTKWIDKDKIHVFSPHEEAFRAAGEKQDILWKISIPANLRQEVLSELHDYNISHFTLFHSEDALIRSIAWRTFDLEDV